MPKGVYERVAYKGKYKPGTQHDTLPDLSKVAPE